MKLRSLFATVAAALLIAVAIASPAQNVAHAQQTPCTEATLACDKEWLVAMQDELLTTTPPPRFNWKSEPDINKWTGVTVSANRVTSLILATDTDPGSTEFRIGSTDGTIATIPEELGNLSELAYLNLYDNIYTGSIPEELGNLSNLTTLDLSENALGGDEPDGLIPEELGNLSNLTYLDLSGNGLGSSIPEEFGNLSNLTTLDLSDNGLWGSIPVELGNLSNLTTLDLSDTGLSGSIPVELGNLSNLTYLDLGDASLTGSIPAGTATDDTPTGLAKLTNLDTLGLYENILEGSIPPELGNLTELENLYLDDNRLTGSIPPELGKLGKLIELRLEKNKLSGQVPGELGNLTALKTSADAILRIDDNNFICVTATLYTDLSTFEVHLKDLNTLNDNKPQLPDCSTLPSIYSIEPDPASVSAEPGGEIQLGVKIFNLSFVQEQSLASGVTFDWASSDNSSITETDESITYTAPSTPGTYTVTASLDNTECYSSDCTATFEVKVIAPVLRIEPDPASATAEPGGEIQLSVNIFNLSDVQEQSLASGVTFDWASGGSPITGAGIGPSITYTAPSTLGTYTVTATLEAKYCSGRPDMPSDCTATFTVNVVQVASPKILRIEPVVEAVVLSAGEHVRLKVDIYGLQDINDQSLGDDVTFDWKTSTGSVPQNSTGAHVVYTASTTPGSDTAKVSLEEHECIGTDTERSDCSAEFQITVRRQSPAPTATPEPQNPAGSIPSALGTLDGRTCEVFTPEAGGTFRGDGFSFSAPPASVQNGEYIAICMEQSGDAEANRSPQHRHTLYGSTFDIAAYDAEGNTIANYALNSPADACIPLPPAIRSRINDISMVSLNPNDISLTARSSSLKNPADISLTAHSSSLRLHSDGDFRICGTLATLPITVAAASHGPPQTPTPEPTSEPTLTPPDTGGSAPSQSPLILALLLALLTTTIGAYILLTPRNKPR